jgi:hypothetical protein
MKVLEKAGRKDSFLSSPVHRSAMLNKQPLKATRCLSLRCGFYYTTRAQEVKDFLLHRMTPELAKPLKPQKGAYLMNTSRGG